MVKLCNLLPVLVFHFAVKDYSDDTSSKPIAASFLPSTPDRMTTSMMYM